MPYQLGQQIEELLLPQAHFVVDRIQVASDLTRVGELAVGFLFVTDGEGFHRRTTYLGHQRSDHAGIYSAA